ncbi:BglG family transcription antiterminator [Neobacillus muris]|uniref:BglG family transcription antiterminator n=1 Tax=Neobacillus muris TaxID=2941334 RepID=UPI00203CB827|nr:PTS sugar transporter subunit IIA [Neobacillus muris]
MDRRKSDILMRLVESANNECGIGKIADIYRVSEKTIRNDIKEINRFLESRNYVEIEFLGNGNVRFFGDQKEIAQLLESNSLYTYKLARQERKLITSFILVQSTVHITMSSIADRLFVSRATILNDLKDVKKFITGYNLSLKSHPNKGLIVEGSEQDRRKLLFEIYSVCIKNIKNRNSDFSFFEIFFLKLLDDKELKTIIEKIIIEIENFHQISLTDGSFDSLLFYLMIMVSRIQKGLYVSEVRVEGEIWLEVSKNILMRISQYCDIKVNNNEEKFLNNIFNSLTYLKNSNEDTEIVKVQIITRKFIEEISFDLQIDLNGDYTFFESLVNHLSSFAQRDNMTLPVEEVFEDHGIPLDIYHSVNKNIHIIQKALDKNITETELYYIVIHVCAAIERKKYEASRIKVILVCAGGLGTSQLIAARLKNHFNFRFVDIVARHDLQNILERNNYDVDLIISTVPLSDIAVNLVVVSPYLTGNDILGIYEKVEKIKKDNIHLDFQENGKKEPKELINQIRHVAEKYMSKVPNQMMSELMNVVYRYFKEEKQHPYLYHFLQPEYIQLNVECYSYEEAIRKSAEKLLENGFIEEPYIQAMIHNVNEYGPYIVISEGFAVPHAGIDDGSNRAGMNLIRLKKPIDFLGKPIKYICCLSVVDAKKHLNAFFHLVNMLQNLDFKVKLDAAETPEDISMIIKDFEQKYI